MMHAVNDFERDGVIVKAGDVIPPGAVEQDDLYRLLVAGLVADDAEPQPTALKGKKERKP